MKYSSDKDLNCFIRGLVNRGYVYKTGRRHGKLYSAKGRFLAPVSCTPSDPRTLVIFAQQLKRKLGIFNHSGLNIEIFTSKNIQKEQQCD